MDRICEFVIESFFHYNISPDESTNYLYNNFSSNDVFQQFLVAHTDPDGGEIPIIFNSLNRRCFESKHKLILPLFANGIEQVRIRRLVATILSDFSCTNYGTRLQCIKTSKGDKYYGAPGLILDKDFNPLLVLTVKYNLTPGVVLLRDTECICHINKSIFANQSGLLEKAIYKKIIPLYAKDNHIRVKMGNYYIGNDCKTTIVIDDCDQFIERPIIPTPSNSGDDSINDFITKHFDVICL